MGIFARFCKSEIPQDFSFRIDDVFTIKGRGVVVTGRMTRGQVKKGSQVLCVTGEGRQFSCTIQDMEQPDPETRRPIHPDEARADGPFQGSYAFLIPNHGPEDFCPGDRLLIGDE